MDKKVKSVYERYDLVKEHFNAAQTVEDIFRQGFVTGYCMAKDEIKPAKRKRKKPAE